MAYTLRFPSFRLFEVFRVLCWTAVWLGRIVVSVDWAVDCWDYRVSLQDVQNSYNSYRSWIVFAEGVFQLLNHAVGLKHRACCIGVVDFDILINLTVIFGENWRKFANEAFQSVSSMLFFTKIKEFGEFSSDWLSWDFGEGPFQDLEFHSSLNWESSFFSNCSLFFEVLLHESIKGWEKIFEINSYQFICVAGDFFFEFNLVNMKLFETADHMVRSAGMMHLLQS